MGRMSGRQYAAGFAMAATTLAVAPPMYAAKPAIKHVLVLSFDGLHALDLANYIQGNPTSGFAQLASHGVRYSNASTSKPSDSFPGTLAPFTGGSPNSTGVFYDDSYDRKLSPPLIDASGKALGSTTCSVIGTEVLYDETIDLNPNASDGGGGIDVRRLPRDPYNNCAPVYPWMYNRVNTVFEVVHDHGLLTAWSDKHVGAYTILEGTKGNGIVDYFKHEVAANGSVATSSVEACIAYDDPKAQAILYQIQGLDSSGKVKQGVPAVFGGNFQEVSVGQKVVNGGYLDENGTPTVELSKALAHSDQIVGKMIAAMKQAGIYDSTLVILATKHGQSPIDPARLQTKNTGVTAPSDVLGAQAAFAIEDDISIIFLADQPNTDASADTLRNAQKAIQAEKIYSGSSLRLLFNDPAADSRVPDITVQPVLGVIYTGSKSKIAEHGGFSVDDTNVGLLVSIPGLTAQVLKEPVDTREVAPTILTSLGIDPNALTAVVREKTPILPGLSSIF